MKNLPEARGYSFEKALGTEGLSVIAEIKRRSPSAGILNSGLDAAALARCYRDGGAACLSILTEATHFGGSPEDLQRARAAAGIPVLRKDFLTTFEDIEETHAMGADALLLIVADIEPSRLRPLHELACELGMDVLTEIRDVHELETAIEAGAYMIAVNQRSHPKSKRFTVDYGKAVAMSRLFAGLENITKIAVSGIGIQGGTRVEDLATAGYDAVLMGEALVTADDPVAMLRVLLASTERVSNCLE